MITVPANRFADVCCQTRNFNGADSLTTNEFRAEYATGARYGNRILLCEGDSAGLSEQAGGGFAGGRISLY